MLFMEIWTVNQEKREEAMKRYAEWKPPEGIKVLGSWIDLTGNRLFYLNEVDDPKAYLEANYFWLDIARCEAVPVMETEEVMKLTPKT